MTAYYGFTVMGEPVPQPRPKARAHGGHARVYMPRGPHQGWEEAVATKAAEIFLEPVEKGIPVSVSIDLYFPWPKSYSKKKRAGLQVFSFLERVGMKATRPDIDNLAKAILDGMNGVAFHDDGQVWELRVRKLYSETDPRAEVRMEVHQ